MLRVPAVCRAAGSGAPDPKPTGALSPRQRRLQRQHRKHREQRQQHQDGQQLPPDATAPAAAAPAAACATELACPHFGACSGCSLSVGLDAPPMLTEAQRFFAEELGYPGLSLLAGPAHGWRRRARLAVRPGPGGGGAHGDGGEPGHRAGIKIGLFAEGSHAVTPIPDCRVHHPAVNRAQRLLEAAVAACGIEPYDEASGGGEMRYVQLTVVEPADAVLELSSSGAVSSSSSSSAPAAGAAAQVQLALVWNSAPDQGGRSAARLGALADKLWGAAGSGGGSGLLHSLWVNFQPAATNTILGPDWRLLHGAELAWVRLGGADVCFSAGSFMQANFGAMDAALAAMAQHVPRGATVCDLHAGVGTIGLSLAATCAPRWVRCVEINGQGLPPFQRSAERLRQRWHQAAGSGSGGGGDESSAPPALEYHVAAAGADPGRWCAGAEVVVCDPPRKGLEPQLLAWLCSPAAPAAGARRLLYLSCGFPALRRDAAALVASGRWRLAGAQAFLFFPGSDHIETLAVFDAT